MPSAGGQSALWCVGTLGGWHHDESGPAPRRHSITKQEIRVVKALIDSAPVAAVTYDHKFSSSQ